MNTYRIKEGAHWKAAPQGSSDRMKLYKAGDLIELSDQAAQGMSRYVDLMPSAAAAPAPAPRAEKPEPPAPPGPAPAAEEEEADETTDEPEPTPTSYGDDIADTPWQTLKARVADMGNADEVRAVLAAEETGKARQSVLDACRARLEELAG